MVSECIHPQVLAVIFLVLCILINVIVVTCIIVNYTVNIFIFLSLNQTVCIVSMHCTVYIRIITNFLVLTANITLIKT